MSIFDKPISQPCLRNQDPIYQALKSLLSADGVVLEIGCGTGQHGVYMAQRLPHIHWFSTDLEPALYGANLWIEEAQSELNLTNLPLAQALDINDTDWPLDSMDYVFSSNVIHFVPMNTVENMFNGINKRLSQNGLVIFYGPFNNNGFTSEGNAGLDAWLKEDIHPEAGIKELRDIKDLAEKYGLTLKDNILMPANNHILIFEKM